MESVFVVQHLHVLPDGVKDVKLIGVYRCRASAEQAIRRLAAQPGFSSHPHIVGPQRTDDDQGFHIDAYVLDKDHWIDGFATM